MNAGIELLIHLLLLVAAPPLMLGIIGRTKAWFAGRKGPPLLQPYHDLIRLVRKGAVYSRTTTAIFAAGAIASLAAPLAAGLILPLASDHAPLGFAGDVIAFAYLLALGRFLAMAAALDTGSSFEGMGASREAAFSALAEPTLFLVLAVLCLLSGSPSFAGGWKAVAWSAPGLAGAPLLAAAVALFAIMLAENSRMPVDDPNTHLELTMIHEVMVLDHSGPDLAFILYGSMVKLFLFGSLLIHVLLPFPAGDPIRGLALFLGGQAAVALLIGVVESMTARLRLVRVPHYLVGAFAVAVVGMVAHLYRVGR